MSIRDSLKMVYENVIYSADKTGNHCHNIQLFI